MIHIEVTSVLQGHIQDHIPTLACQLWTQKKPHQAMKVPLDQDLDPRPPDHHLQNHQELFLQLLSEEWLFR